MKFLHSIALLTIASLFASLFIFSFSACNPDGNSADSTADSSAVSVSYYRHLASLWNPVPDFKGRYELSADDAKSINHYRFTYEDNKLVALEYMRGAALLDYSSVGAAKIVFEYTDSTEVRTFFNSKGEQVRNSDDVYKELYTLNEKGQRVELRFVDENGQSAVNSDKIATYKWRVMDDGMIAENRFNAEGVETVMNETCPFFELRFTYDANGYLTRVANYAADTLTECTAENCGEIGVSYFKYNVDANGNLLNYAVYSVTDQLSNLYWGYAKYEYKYDEFGNRIEAAAYDEDNELLSGESNAYTEQVYDAAGSIVERRFYDADKKLMVPKRFGAAVIKYSYEADGMPKDTVKMGVDMTEMSK